MLQTVSFSEDNKARYWMDFSYWEGLPSDLEFVVYQDESHHKGWVTLKAPGYGMPGDYGNGSVYISEDQLPTLRR